MKISLGKYSAVILLVVGALVSCEEPTSPVEPPVEDTTLLVRSSYRIIGKGFRKAPVTVRWGSIVLTKPKVMDTYIDVVLPSTPGAEYITVNGEKFGKRVRLQTLFLDHVPDTVLQIKSTITVRGRNLDSARTFLMGTTSLDVITRNDTAVTLRVPSSPITDFIYLNEVKSKNTVRVIKTATLYPLDSTTARELDTFLLRGHGLPPDPRVRLDTFVLEVLRSSDSEILVRLPEAAVRAPFVVDETLLSDTLQVTFYKRLIPGSNLLFEWKIRLIEHWRYQPRNGDQTSGVREVFATGKTAQPCESFKDGQMWYGCGTDTIILDGQNLSARHRFGEGSGGFKYELTRWTRALLGAVPYTIEADTIRVDLAGEMVASRLEASSYLYNFWQYGGGGETTTNWTVGPAADQTGSYVKVRLYRGKK